jgi:Flp pilus assembly protein TadD
MLIGAAADAASSSTRLAAPPISAANSPVRGRPATAQQLPDRGRLGRSAATLREAAGAAGRHRRLHSADARTPAGSRNAVSAGDPASARDAAAARDADTAERVERHNAAGYALRKSGDFAGAVREYSAALALAPRHFKAVFNRGFCYDKASLRF